MAVLQTLRVRAISDGDSPELRLQKTLLIFACGFMGLAAMLWVAIYQAMGIHYSSNVPFAYLLVSAATLAIYLWNRNFQFFRLAQTALYLFVPFIMQWSVGSYVTSSGVMLFALLAPVGVMVFQGAKQSIPWFIAYIVLTAMSGFFDWYLGYDEQTAGVPMQTIALFFVLNFVVISSIVYTLIVYSVNARDRIQQELDRQHELLQAEQEKSERLLLNVLPRHIAERLKQEQNVIAEGIVDSTVIFIDITGFTRLASEIPPHDIVRMLNQVFSWFDGLADNYGLEKIKTVGDAYMAAGGLFDTRAKYTESIADMALEIRKNIGHHKTPAGEPLDVHIGIATGPLVGGVIGAAKLHYDLWGNTVNIASHLSAEAPSGGILVDAMTYQRLHERYRLEGPMDAVVKGKYPLTTYTLHERLPRHATLPPVGAPA